MPSFTPRSPPIPPHGVDGSRPLPSAQVPLPTSTSTQKISAPLPISTSTQKTSAPLAPAKSTPITTADNKTPLVSKESSKQAANISPDGIIDMEVFEQVRELGDDDPLFLKEMVDAYFDQAKNTFRNMDLELEKRDLAELSSLGHFLKGSSAALGVFKVQSSCEKIQNFGQLRDDSGPITEAEAIAKIRESISRAKKEYGVAEGWLKAFLKDYPDE